MNHRICDAEDYKHHHTYIWENPVRADLPNRRVLTQTLKASSVPYLMARLKPCPSSSDFPQPVKAGPDKNAMEPLRQLVAIIQLFLQATEASHAARIRFQRRISSIASC